MKSPSAFNDDPCCETSLPAGGAYPKAKLLTRRLIQLFLGLVLYGFSLALMIRASFGLDPWDMFHQGVSLHFGWSFGTILNVVGGIVLLLWIPLRQRPGFGTISNIVVIGLAADASLAVLPEFSSLAICTTLLVTATVLNAIAGSAYIGAGLGPGPRDGLMTGIVRRTGWSVRVVRTGIEATVLAIGWWLGGSVGFGTVFYAITIGPTMQVFMPIFSIDGRSSKPAHDRDQSPINSRWDPSKF